MLPPAIMLGAFCFTEYSCKTKLIKGGQYHMLIKIKVLFIISFVLLFSGCTRASTWALPELFSDAGKSRLTLTSKPDKLKDGNNSEKEAERPDLFLDVASGVDSYIEIDEIGIDLNTGRAYATGVVIDKMPSANQREVSRGVREAGRSDTAYTGAALDGYANFAGTMMTSALQAYGLRVGQEIKEDDNKTKVDIAEIDAGLEKFFIEHSLGGHHEEHSEENGQDPNLQEDNNKIRLNIGDLSPEQKQQVLRMFLGDKNEKENP